MNLALLFTDTRRWVCSVPLSSFSVTLDLDCHCSHFRHSLIRHQPADTLRGTLCVEKVSPVGIQNASQCCPGSSLGKSADAVTTRWMQHWKVRMQPCWRKPFHHFGTKQDCKCTFEGRKLRCSFGQETAEAACSQYANAVVTLEESDELGHALETWSDATAQYWASSGRVGQPTLSGKFAKCRMRPVLGETFMPLGCVILEGGGNAELRAWKVFWPMDQHHSQSFPRDRPSRTHTVRCKEDCQFHPGQ